MTELRKFESIFKTQEHWKKLEHQIVNDDDSLRRQVALDVLIYELVKNLGGKCDYAHFSELATLSEVLFG